MHGMIRPSTTVANICGDVELGRRAVHYTVRRVEITTCGQLYTRWRAQNPKKRAWRSVPEQGITTAVEYADTHPTLATEIANDGVSDTNVDCQPLGTVLCLHGAPGTHACFADIIKHLHGRGYRVIAPNFPTYALTEATKAFRHSAQEKAEYVKDFLTAINVTKLDLVISHSSAIYPATILWEDPAGPVIRSICLLNPAGHRTLKSMKPTWFTCNAVTLYQRPRVRWLFRTHGTAFLTTVGTVAVKVDNMDNVMLSATTMKYCDKKSLVGRLEKLRDRQVPILYVFSERDALVDREIFHEMATTLGAQEENFDLYDENGLRQKTAVTDSSIRVIVFQEGGHYAYLKYLDIVKEAIDEHLARVMETKGEQSITAVPETPIPITVRRGSDCESESNCSTDSSSSGSESNTEKVIHRPPVFSRSTSRSRARVMSQLHVDHKDSGLDSSGEMSASASIGSLTSGDSVALDAAAAAADVLRELMTTTITATASAQSINDPSSVSSAIPSATSSDSESDYFDAQTSFDNLHDDQPHAHYHEQSPRKESSKRVKPFASLPQLNELIS